MKRLSPTTAILELDGEQLTLADARRILDGEVGELLLTTPGLIDALLEVYNRGVVPAVPEQGSVGASGDLAPLAHLALVVMGEGHAFVEGSTRSSDREAPVSSRLLSGRAALRKARLEPYR